MELQNIQMKATSKETVNITLIDFQAHIISNVEGMMALQLEYTNKGIAVGIQEEIQSSPIIKVISKLSMKTTKNISSLQRRTEPINETSNNITPTQNENMTLTITNQNNYNLDSLTQNNKNIASSNLQEDSDDLSWEEESESHDHNVDEIIPEKEDEDDLYTKVEKEKTDKKEKKKINKKIFLLKPNKSQTCLGSKKP